MNQYEETTVYTLFISFFVLFCDVRLLTTHHLSSGERDPSWALCYWITVCCWTCLQFLMLFACSWM